MSGAATLRTLLVATIAALLLVLFSGCAALEASACGELTYRRGVCEGFDGFRYVQRPPAHWLPGTKS